MCVNTRIHTHTREYYIVNRTKCVCTYIFICIYLNVIGMIFALSNSELHFETVYTILISRALSFPLVSCKRLREWLSLGGRSFVLVSSQEHSDIWFNKGAQAQASSACGASVNACLSDYWSLFIRLLKCKLLSSECASYSRSLCNPTQALTWYPDTISSQQALPKLIEWIL